MKTNRKRRMSTLNPPFGVTCLSYLTNKICPRFHVNRFLVAKISVLFLTYIAYVCYHMTRKPIAVVKSVLHRNCSDLPMPKNLVGIDADTWCDYAPFDGPDASAMLGILDSAFLFSYAIAMFGSGFVAERVSLRYFLSFGMLTSGLFCYMFGLAKTSNIHSMFYFIVVQAMAGICQTTGWPGVVTVVSRWSGKAKRGLIFGIWNSHTSVGNMLGTYIAASYVDKDWSLSFIYPGLFMGIVGFIIFLFLVDSPELVGMQQDVIGVPTNNRRVENDSDDSDVNEVMVDSHPDQESNPSLRSLRGSINSENSSRFDERTPILGSQSSSINRTTEHKAVGFAGALKIPGVLEFSLCLFFSKLVNYTFLFWLPLYIKNSTPLSSEKSAELSMVFDIGGIFGAIIAGVVSDYSKMPAMTCTFMLGLAAPLLLVYQFYGSMFLMLNIGMLFIVGLFVNGPYALITTSVSAELGQHKSLQGNSKALATVTAIIDGTGSIGAAIGPLLAGWMAGSGWQNVFYMLIISDVLAMLLLSRLVGKELGRFRRSNVRNSRIE